jgi:thiol-disulfide isomerase/thioredoxin
MKKVETKSEMKGIYKSYSPEAVKNAKWKIVLFFHASWCPTCKASEADILANKIPENLTILKVNYDDSDNLKTQYGVLTQSTFVEVDNNGKEIKKWNWWKLKDIIDAVK